MHKCTRMCARMCLYLHVCTCVCPLESRAQREGARAHVCTVLVMLQFKSILTVKVPDADGWFPGAGAISAEQTGREGSTEEAAANMEADGRVAQGAFLE